MESWNQKTLGCFLKRFSGVCGRLSPTTTPLTTTEVFFKGSKYSLLLLSLKVPLRYSDPKGIRLFT